VATAAAGRALQALLARGGTDLRRRRRRRRYRGNRARLRSPTAVIDTLLSTARGSPASYSAAT